MLATQVIIWLIVCKRASRSSLLPPNTMSISGSNKFQFIVGHWAQLHLALWLDISHLRSHICMDCPRCQTPTCRWPLFLLGGHAYLCCLRPELLHNSSTAVFSAIPWIWSYLFCHALLFQCCFSVQANFQQRFGSFPCRMARARA